jgi:hypothetical protein
MANTREPILHAVSILSLRPTQMTVGMREVKEKRKRLREFWKEHKSKKKQGEFLVYPYDAKGERRHFKDLPKSITDLKDDPFRSLAGELRRSGGFAKDTTPFSEFLWADFLRRQISRANVDANFEKAMEKSLALAKSKDAIYLPGWCGPASDD